MTRNPFLSLLGILTEFAFVVLAALSWDDTATFYKLIAVLGLFALWDIERAVRR